MPSGVSVKKKKLTLFFSYGVTKGISGNHRAAGNRAKVGGGRWVQHAVSWCVSGVQWNIIAVAMRRGGGVHEGSKMQIKWGFETDVVFFLFFFVLYCTVSSTPSAASKLMTKCIVTNEPPGCQNSANTPGRLFGSSLLLSGLLFYQKLPRVWIGDTLRTEGSSRHHTVELWLKPAPRLLPFTFWVFHPQRKATTPTCTCFLH